MKVSEAKIPKMEIFRLKNYRFYITVYLILVSPQSFTFNRK